MWLISLFPNPMGLKVLPIADGGPNAYQLRQLLPVLRRYYDLIVLDLKKEDHWLIDTAMELADAVIVTSLPAPRLQAAIAQVVEPNLGARVRRQIGVDPQPSLCPRPSDPTLSLPVRAGTAG